MANKIPGDVKARLLARAYARFNGHIRPVRGARDIEGGFRVDLGLNWYCLWFNDHKDSTHIVYEVIENLSHITSEEKVCPM